MRLADEIRPAFIFLENVPAIRKRGGSVVVGELARRGYDCRWITLSAADVGANHKRERWWLLANAESQQDRRLQFKTVSANLGGNSKNVADAAGCRRRQKYTNAGRQSQGTLAPKEWGGPPDSGWWEIEPPVGRLVDGIPFRVGQLRALGNSVVPAQAREAFERLLGIKK
jgi:DNA (cytosine-5)-methyltransferase 1